MNSVSRFPAVRYSIRKRRVPHFHRQPVPALSPQESAALVLGIIEARLGDGLSLEQVRWEQYCRDSAVVNVVAQQLKQGHATEGAK